MSIFKLLDYCLCPIFNYSSLYLGFYVFRNPFLQILKWISRYIQPYYSFFQNEWILCIFWNFSVLPSKCHISNQEKFLKRNYSRTAVIFQALKMKCSLVICRIAIKQEMSLFQTFGLPLFGPIGCSWTGLASSNDTTKKTLLQNWHRLFNACWGTSALVSFMCVPLHGQNLLCWTVGYTSCQLW